MWNIKHCARLYNDRVDSVIKKDCEMGLFHKSSDISLMCKEMLACMQFYFRGIYYAEIIEDDRDTGVYFQEFDSDNDLYTEKEKENQFLNFSEGWHTIVINKTEIKEFRERVRSTVRNDKLYEHPAFEAYREEKNELERILFQYGLMFIFYHEYGHVADGHKLAEYHGKIEITNSLQRALEYSADMFAVNQTCYHMISDYMIFGKYGKADEDKVQAILDEFPLMLLGAYIFLDGLYRREEMTNDDFRNRILADDTHIAPFIRQHYIFEQFAGIWTNPKYSGYNNLNIDRLNYEALHCLDAYERAVYNAGISEAPFVYAEGAMGMSVISQAQQCWNEYYEKLQEFVSPGAGIGRYDVLNVAKKGYE